MSTRTDHRSRGSNRGSRGGRTGRNGTAGRGSGSFNKPKVKTLSDYTYSLGTAKQASDYETTTDYLVNHITKTFTYGIDVAKALDSLSPTDLSHLKPAMKISGKTDTDEKAAETEQFKIEFKSEYDAFSVDDIISKTLWTKRFMEAQGNTIVDNLIYRDNQSSMKLEANGKASSGKRTRHFHIKFFFITDLIQKDEVSIMYCPTDRMIADYHTKPLIGAKFYQFRKEIMNLPIS